MIASVGAGRRGRPRNGERICRKARGGFVHAGIVRHRGEISDLYMQSPRRSGVRQILHVVPLSCHRSFFASSWFHSETMMSWPYFSLSCLLASSPSFATTVVRSPGPLVPFIHTVASYTLSPSAIRLTCPT